MADQRVSGPEPDIIALRLRSPEPKGGLVVAETPPRINARARVETETALYARKANRIVIHHELGRVVAMIEVVSPGNKDTKHAVASFIAKAVDFIRNGIHFLMIDLFPSGPRDPQGIAQAIWDELVGESLGTRPADKLLTVAAYDAGDELTAYVDALAVGDLLPRCPFISCTGLVRECPARTDLHGLVGRDPQAHTRPRRTALERRCSSRECHEREGASAASLRSKVPPCLATRGNRADAVQGPGGPFRLPAKLHVSSTVPIKYRRWDLNPHPLASSGDTIPNSVAGAGVRASAVWDFLRVVAWVRAFAV